MKTIFENWHKYLSEDKKELKKISKELNGASKMHKSQADRIDDLLDDLDGEELEENIDDVAQLEKEYLKGKHPATLQKLVKLSKMGKYDMNRLRKKMKAVKEGKKNCGCGQDPCITYGVQAEAQEAEEKELEESELDERCQKGYKTHETRKTKQMYGKTYRNCVKAESLDEDSDADKGLEDAIGELASTIEDLDVSIDYLASAVTGEDALGLNIKQKTMGRQAPRTKAMSPVDEALDSEDESEEGLEEKKKKKKKKKKSKGKKDACYHKVKARYDVWPSAYASGALVKCRKVGAANWGNKSKKNENQEFEDILVQVITEELVDLLEKKKKKKKKRKGGKKDGKGASSKGYTLRDWFKGGGWVQTGGKYDGKPCAKQPGQKTKPYCRDPDDRAKLSKKDRNKRAAKKRREDPNPNRKGKAKNVSQKKKRKSKKESVEMITTQQLTEIILDELSDNVYYHITDATYDDGTVAEDIEFWDDVLEEAEYRGRKVKLNKPTRGDVKKFKVYVKNAKGNVVKVNFGDKKMRIKKSNPKRRKSFRARHNCDNPGPKWKARYWSCRKW